MPIGKPYAEEFKQRARKLVSEQRLRPSHVARDLSSLSMAFSLLGGALTFDTAHYGSVTSIAPEVMRQILYTRRAMLPVSLEAQLHQVGNLRIFESFPFALCPPPCALSPARVSLFCPAAHVLKRLQIGRSVQDDDTRPSDSDPAPP